MAVSFEFGQSSQTKFKWGEGTTVPTGVVTEITRYSNQEPGSVVIESEENRIIVSKTNSNTQDTQYSTDESGQLHKRMQATHLATLEPGSFEINEKLAKHGILPITHDGKFVIVHFRPTPNSRIVSMRVSHTT